MNFSLLLYYADSLPIALLIHRFNRTKSTKLTLRRMSIFGLNEQESFKAPPEQQYNSGTRRLSQTCLGVSVSNSKWRSDPRRIERHGSRPTVTTEDSKFVQCTSVLNGGSGSAFLSAGTPLHHSLLVSLREAGASGGGACTLNTIYNQNIAISYSKFSQTRVDEVWWTVCLVGSIADVPPLRRKHGTTTSGLNIESHTILSQPVFWMQYIDRSRRCDDDAACGEWKEVTARSLSPCGSFRSSSEGWSK
ncbi:hypothetical protein BLNAU_18891 [Blattamonas nauphoetae]|uniref:Uncharacterized protein n=1 Tax=Blattamonas nauphoetae TaxID=2049346 RepID=A0ABQ9X3F0_9EUKA|nr:hypothetical protein BLNAU_18891 [Blattamonas nauphoetae]